LFRFIQTNYHKFYLDVKIDLEALPGTVTRKDSGDLVRNHSGTHWHLNLG